jgi:hypothetical protein
MQSVKVPTSRDYQEYLVNSLKDPERAAGYITAILEESDPEPELLASALDDVAIALGGEGDRQWVKDFGASDKSQAVYELAAWLDSLGLKLTVDVQYSEKFMADFREAQQDIENGDVVPLSSIRRDG